MHEVRKRQEGEARWRECAPRMDTGSEGGRVLDDEEYQGSCRITRERCETYDAITCGVCGEFMHTAFAGPDESAEVYAQMKAELKAFVDADPADADERSDFYDSFYDKY